jgi:hypothetical protein
MESKKERVHVLLYKLSASILQLEFVCNQANGEQEDKMNIHQKEKTTNLHEGEGLIVIENNDLQFYSNTCIKGSPEHVAPACARSKEGSDHFESYVRNISLYFCKRLFSGLEPMTSWSQGNSFTSAPGLIFLKYLHVITIITSIVLT